MNPHAPRGRLTVSRLRRSLAAIATMALLLITGLAASPANARPTDLERSATAAASSSSTQLQAQVLTWTAGDNFLSYLSAPTTATAGPATLVFENSRATGNTTGMQHTLTFETGDPRYNSDVDVNILADPTDSNGGRWTVDVVLSPGTYRYFCSIPGHGGMTGLLVVSGGGSDTTPPTVTATVSGEKDPTGAYVGSATVTLSATDSGSGVDRVEYSLDGGPFGTYSAPVTVNQAGQHTVSYRATDKAGNTSSPQSVSFSVVEPPPTDTTPPTVTAAVTGQKDANGAYVGSATVTVSATDTESGVDRIEYSLDGGAYAAYSAPVTVNQPGQHTVSYRATDKAGNTSSPQSVSFTVVETPPADTTPPTVTAAVTGQKDANGNYVGSATVTLSATDSGSGVDRIEYSLDGQPYAGYSAPVTVNQPGQHTVSYRATDKAGNTSSPQSVSFTVVETPPADTTPPTVTAAVTGQQDANGNYVGSATVTLSATDTQSGVDRIEYALDGGAYAAYSAPVTVNHLGQHTVSYRATDKAGNTSAPQSVSFTVVETPPADTTPPTVTAAVTGQQDANGAYVGSATVTVSATDSGSGVDRIEYSLDGQPYAAYSAPVTVNQPGQHTVSYRATDKAGNTSAPQSVSFTVVEPPAPDTSPPTATAAVSGQLDNNGAYVGSATVILSATDAGSGVDRIEYSLDAQPYARYSAPVTVNQPGQHTLSYRATDKAGNTSGTASVTFTVVASGPGPDCPVKDTRPTVWLGTVDSGVPNRVVEGDCTINNVIEDERTWPNHGEFVSYVTTIAEHLHHLGVITHHEHGRLVSAAGRSGVGKPDEKNGYQPLLDNSAASFGRWQQVGAGDFTRNADGSITSRPVPGLGMLWFPVAAYGDFSLKLQWRDDATGDGRANSGVFVRFPNVHQHPDESRPEWVAIKYGHELQILDRPDGDQYKSGSVYGFDRVDLAGANVTPKGTWNDYEIRVVGQHYSVFRNGVLINDYVNTPDAVFTPPRADDPGGAGRQSASGYIGLQNHGAADVISFRNVRIAPLSPCCPTGTSSSSANPSTCC
ncbi:Ig-like domain (group 3) [Micromonospora rhizosphaerae]|uniref:Ig-like domain (Group 3) n=1 Tax=Micromonospora rhizosphaerae TaxID=568872 RepID=A0A1C6SI93_9ACTN|nr:family 16 glycoside hydrolase [Micromonospora rhizosphaerae]SCL29143.1 Ig-like domain (group 3) [Micromonospora rhizosphaerae]